MACLNATARGSANAMRSNVQKAKLAPPPCGHRDTWHSIPGTTRLLQRRRRRAQGAYMSQLGFTKGPFPRQSRSRAITVFFKKKFNYLLLSIQSPDPNATYILHLHSLEVCPVSALNRRSDFKLIPTLLMIIKKNPHHAGGLT